MGITPPHARRTPSRFKALFTLGKFAIGTYLGKASIGTTYGAAGPVIVMIVWVYYSAQILFLGAEFTQAYAQHHAQVVPSDDAEWIPVENGKSVTAAGGPDNRHLPGTQQSDVIPTAKPALANFATTAVIIIASVILGWRGMHRASNDSRARHSKAA